MEELRQALAAYQKKWETLLAEHADDEILHSLVPTAVAWKVADLDTYNELLTQWQDKIDQLQSKWLNGRWITCAVLREGQDVGWGIHIVKFMQRRPGSDDALGLDHVDFYSPQVASAKEGLLTNTAGLKVTDEENGACKWLSLWFADTEAKLRTGTTLHVCAEELLEAERRILHP